MSIFETALSVIAIALVFIIPLGMIAAVIETLRRDE